MVEPQQASPSAGSGRPARGHGDHVGGRVAALLGGSSALGMAPIFARWAMGIGGLGAAAAGFWRMILSLPVMLAWVTATGRQRRLAGPGRARIDKPAKGDDVGWQLH